MLAGRMTPRDTEGDEQDKYQAYLIRLWRSKSRGRWSWRASLESPRTGERQLFPCLDQLFTFLSDRTRKQTAANGVGRQEVDLASVPGAEEERYDV